MRLIPLKPLYGDGFVSFKLAIIDDEDFNGINQHRWCQLNKHGDTYVVAQINGKQTYLHNFVSGNNFSDHKNHNTLDNRKFNLRSSNEHFNGGNRFVQHNKHLLTSQFKGVHFDKKTGKFRAGIKYKTKRNMLNITLAEKVELWRGTKRYDDRNMTVTGGPQKTDDYVSTSVSKADTNPTDNVADRPNNARARKAALKGVNP